MQDFSTHLADTDHPATSHSPPSNHTPSTGPPSAGYTPSFPRQPPYSSRTRSQSPNPYNPANSTASPDSLSDQQEPRWRSVDTGEQPQPFQPPASQTSSDEQHPAAARGSGQSAARGNIPRRALQTDDSFGSRAGHVYTIRLIRVWWRTSRSWRGCWCERTGSSRGMFWPVELISSGMRCIQFVGVVCTRHEDAER